MSTIMTLTDAQNRNGFLINGVSHGMPSGLISTSVYIRQGAVGACRHLVIVWYDRRPSVI